MMTRPAGRGAGIGPLQPDQASALSPTSNKTSICSRTRFFTYYLPAVAK
jgi:hypothetical protein